MLQCQCSNCKSIFECSSSDFGKTHHCEHCGLDFKLATTNLIHYNLPKRIEIQLLTEQGTPFTEFTIPIMVNYGYYIPPLLSDNMGHVTITQELILEAKREHISTGIMDYKYDDYSLNRYVTIRVLDKKEATLKAKNRLGSGWPINNLEKKLYGDTDKLAKAFTPLKNVAPVEKFLDLSQVKDLAELEITIIKK